MQGFADLLTDDVAGPLNEKQRHQLARIRAASDHLLTLIDEILTFARQQAGRSELRPARGGPGRAGARGAVLVEPLAAAKGLNLALRIPTAPLPFLTDPGKVRLIILNLAANAVKFTDAGEVRLELEAAGERCCCAWATRGSGSPPSTRSTFSPPSGRWTSRRAAGGTGLGLAVTRRV